MLHAISLALFLTACHPQVHDVVVTVDADVHTVLNVRWRSMEPGPSRVDYGFAAGSTPFSTPLDAGGTAHERTLLGLPPLTTVYLRPVTLVDGEQWSEAEIGETENVPAGLPSLEVTVADFGRMSPERYLLGTTMGDASTLFAIDRDGTVRWYCEGPSDTMWPDVAFTAQGNDLLYAEYDQERVEDIGAVKQITLGSDSVTSTRTPNGHHAFDVLPDGAIAWLALDTRSVDDGAGGHVAIAGDKIVETAPDGTTRDVYSTWDWLPWPTGGDPGFYHNMLDWTHANTIRYDADADTYVTSFANVDTIVELDRESGVPLRTFGTLDGYNPDTDSALFASPHDPTVLPDDHLLLYTTTDAVSGVLEYEIDDATRSLHEVWRYGFEEGVEAEALGQASRLENGNTLVSFGMRGVVREVTPQGEVVWELLAPSGTWFGRVRLFDDFYDPG
jgi:hypothetical protein